MSFARGPLALLPRSTLTPLPAPRTAPPQLKVLQVKVRPEAMLVSAGDGMPTNVARPRGHHVQNMQQHMCGFLRRFLEEIRFPMAAFEV